MTVRYGAVTLDWLGAGAVRVEGELGVVVYTDPGVLVDSGGRSALDGYDARDGDLVLLTHDRHYDPDAVRRVAHEDALVVAHESVDIREGEVPFDVERVRADESFVLGPLDLFTTGYGESGEPLSSANETRHRPAERGCGYAVTIDGVRVFWPGHTDAVVELGEFDVDVLLAPIGDDRSSDRTDVVELVERLRPGLVIPIAYDPAEIDSSTFVVDVATRGIPVALDEFDGDRDGSEPRRAE